jgi:predicted dehydrogenase
MARLNWGMVGGGEGSQIGPAHRLGAQADGNFVLAAGALDVDAAKGRAYAERLGVAPDRAYGDWREMLEGERGRDDRVDLVTVATPNSTHFEITKAFLQAGFNVLCEKPMTMTVEEGEEIVRVARDSGRICAVNYCYSAYPMVREMRQMARRGADRQGSPDRRELQPRTPRGRHRCGQPARALALRPGAWRVSRAVRRLRHPRAAHGQFYRGRQVDKLSADFASTIDSRVLEDDAMVNFRMSRGTVGRLWTSSVAIGRQHGFDIQVFGETGGLRWARSSRTRCSTLPGRAHADHGERGSGIVGGGRAAVRVAIAHPEGFPLAVANIYVDLAAAIRGDARDGLPTAEDGLRSMAAVYAAVASAKAEGAWTDARPPMFR